ncbi:hypothetical protein FDX19_00010 [Citrobacter sp. wls619]|uniref:hypothetical protein n=1 Tax=Citrobacter sp. wls619 TaxID=2576432 RepID=UPI0010C944CB|nr:hypothetical protein [Citrobacter sp. wls619]TKV14564.1 hypothetical protein FDX19_00010 [Citrobacter sp. wls619]
MNINKDEKIITIIKNKGNFYWFAAFKEMWVLDRIKWGDDFISNGFKDANIDNHQERYYIAIVGKDNADDFIQHLINDEYSIKKIDLANEFYKRLSPTTKWWDIYDLFPDLFIDFDSLTLYSEFIENMHYEWYVPDGWNGKFMDFCEGSILPSNEKFWIKNGIDHRKEIISRS